MAGWVERWWTAPDGARLHARDYAGAEGEASPPVFCLHGLTRNARDFGSLAPAIASTGRRVLAFDVRGRGRSAYAQRADAYVLPVYVADVAGWAGALGVARAEVVGTSMGGLIAMALATERPDLVGDAVLNDIGPEIAPEGLARISAYTGESPAAASWAEAADYAAAQNRAAFPAYGRDDWAAFARRLFREGPDGRPVLDYDPRIAEPMRGAAGARAPDLWPLFDRLAEDRRLLLVRGERSDILAAATAARMAERAPSLRRVEAEGIGHAPMLDEPGVREAVLEFFAPPRP